jgi:hypothetical protein
MVTNTTLVLPNPNTPLAFLPPEVADQFQVSAYVMVAGLSAFVWDWLMSIPDEYKLLRKSRSPMIHGVYFLSRLGTLSFCVTATIFQSQNVANCQMMLYAIASSFMLAISATSFLFYVRVRAIWHNAKAITVFFGLLWLGTVGTSGLVIFAISGAHIGTTQRCINTAVRPYVSTAIVLNAINDTLIFIAISTRLVVYTCADETWRANVRSFARGDGLPRISKGLLQGGQLYFFATIGTSIVVAATALSPSVPPFYRAMVSIPNVALENAMACRVFRAVGLGFIRDDVGSVQVSTGTGTGRARFDGNDIALKDTAFRMTRPVKINVDIAKTTYGAEGEFIYDKQEGSDAEQV